VVEGDAHEAARDAHAVAEMPTRALSGVCRPRRRRAGDGSAPAAEADVGADVWPWTFTTAFPKPPSVKPELKADTVQVAGRHVVDAVTPGASVVA
jgi:hypothetical protein